MNSSLHSDVFTVVNGPEDGAEFPVTRAPFIAGADNSCAVVLTLDDSVEARHARIDVESEGYRIRSLGAAPVFVDGKQAGMIRSRLARNGSYVQIGNTLLVVECSCDGLASRSRGIGLPSDIGWAIRIGIRGALQLGKFAFRLARRLTRQLFSSWLLLAGIVVALYFLVPSVRVWVNGILGWVRYYLGQLLAQL